MLCQRVESNRPFAKGGWFHFYDKQAPVRVPAPRFVPKKSVSSIKTTICGDDLAKELGVSIESLKVLGVGWSNECSAWLFPMRNGQNEIIGYNRRFPNGDKRIVAGTSAGLYIPQVKPSEPKGLLYICEGGSDTAALFDLGIFAVGRFNVNSGADFLREFIKLNKFNRLVIIPDNDEIKQLGNKQGRPGILGAEKLKADLKMTSVIWMPPSPIKDVRQFKLRGGTKQMIENEIKNKVWTKC